MSKLCFKETIYSSLLYIIVCYLDYFMQNAPTVRFHMIDMNAYITHLHYICNEMILETRLWKDDHDNTWQSRIVLLDDE